MKRGEAGFTIIEVMLFLAISAALLVMVLAGTNSLIKRQRFSDTVDNLQAYIQKQYEEVVSGVNPRSTTNVPECSSRTAAAGTQENCLLVGKMLSFNTNANTITSRYIISTQELPAEYSAGTDQEKLANIGLKAPSVSSSVYELRWGAKITGATRADSSAPIGRSEIKNIAFIRMPDAKKFVTLFFTNGFTGNGDVGQSLRNAVLQGPPNRAIDPPSSPASPSGIVCVKNTADYGANSPIAAIQFVRGQGSSTIAANYQPGALCR